MTPTERYQSDLQRQGFLFDPVQQMAVQHTQLLYDHLVDASQSINKSSFLQRLMGKKTAPVKGLYFWGGSGRGKTYLVDCFYECLPFKEKHRVHFHRFMLDIHEQLRRLPKSPNPLNIVADRIAQRARVLCLDEFHVHDIADAMLMAGLLDALFERGVTLVATSNIAIIDLYKNGLQRERFLHAIELLQEHTLEVDLQDTVDYRFKVLTEAQIYRIVPVDEGESFIAGQLGKIAPCQAKRDRSIRINGREIAYKALADDVIWFDFDALCNTPRSANDYIQLAQSFHTMFVSNIYVMSEAHDSVAKRFIHLVDALYDHNVKLIITAERAAAEIYSGRRMSFAFARTISRLSEMGSKKYLHQAHRIHA